MPAGPGFAGATPSWRPNQKKWDLPMQFDFTTLAASERYRLLVSTILPRPIAWTTTIDAEGRVNAAPFSFFNCVSSEPPLLALGVQPMAGRPVKDTLQNITANGEFVIHLVSEELAPQMNICAIDFPPGTDELAEAGLTAVPSLHVSVPRIAEAPAAFECRLFSRTDTGHGGGAVLLGEVLAMHLADRFFDAEKRHVDAKAMQLIARMHGRGFYARTTDMFDMPRIALADWQGREKD
jgi:flavin reductase (DIM6/NTAB) family NADH-FMN oxidoreductase RutF